MDRRGASVKGTRAYDGTGRQERARRQLDVTLDAALALFLDEGYRAITVEAIAGAAGISAATIYKSYGGKSGLVRRLCTRALEGVGPVPAEERSNALRTASDPRQLVEGWGRLTAEVSPRVSPIMLLLRTAGATDPEAAALYDELDAARLRRMTANARSLAAAGHLGAGVTTRDARDVLWLCSSPELYDLLIRRRRWSLTKFQRFVTETMVSALL